MLARQSVWYSRRQADGERLSAASLLPHIEASDARSSLLASGLAFKILAAGATLLLTAASVSSGCGSIVAGESGNEGPTKVGTSITQQEISCASDDWLGKWYQRGLWNRATRVHQPDNRFMCIEGVFHYCSDTASIADRGYWDTFAIRAASGASAGDYVCDGSEWVRNDRNLFYWEPPYLPSVDGQTSLLVWNFVETPKRISALQFDLSGLSSTSTYSDVCLLYYHPDGKPWTVGGTNEIVCSTIEHAQQGNLNVSLDLDTFLPAGSWVTCMTTNFSPGVPASASFKCTAQLAEMGARTPTRPLRFPPVDQFNKLSDSPGETTTTGLLLYESRDRFPIHVQSFNVFSSFMDTTAMDVCLFWLDQTKQVLKSHCVPQLQRGHAYGNHALFQLPEKWSIPTGHYLGGACTTYGALSPAPNQHLQGHPTSDCAIFAHIDVPLEQQNVDAVFNRYQGYLILEDLEDYCRANEAYFTSHRNETSAFRIEGCLKDNAFYAPPHPGGQPDCPTGWFRCGTQCVNLNTDVANCGSCGTRCQQGQTCSQGICTGCSAGLTACSGACVDTSSDPSNCGSCGRSCGASETCVSGQCQCVQGLTRCGSQCVNTSNDPSNCGSCGRSCGASETCVSGQCQCVQGLTRCGSQCVNTSNDPSNCGSCGRSCGASETCVSGQCQCVQGLTRCGSQCVNTSNDPSNCGSCGRICATGESCVSGSCVCTTGSCQPCEISAFTSSQHVLAIYIGYLKRFAEPSGLDYWRGEIDRGALSAVSVAENFGGSAAAVQQYPFLGGSDYSTSTINTFLHGVYAAVFNDTSPDPGGISYWRELLQNDNSFKGSIILHIMMAAHADRFGGSQNNWCSLCKKIQVADYFQQRTRTRPNCDAAITSSGNLSSLISLTANVTCATDVTAYRTNVDNYLAMICP